MDPIVSMTMSTTTLTDMISTSRVLTAARLLSSAGTILVTAAAGRNLKNVMERRARDN